MTPTCWAFCVNLTCSPTWSTTLVSPPATPTSSPSCGRWGLGPPSRPCCLRDESAPPLPGSVLGQRPEPERHELVVEVASLPFLHPGTVMLVLRTGTAAVDHRHHLPDRTPHREGRDRPRWAHRCQREGRTRVVTNLTLNRATPVQETPNLADPHPGDGDGDHRLIRAELRPRVEQPVEGSDMSPGADM